MSAKYSFLASLQDENDFWDLFLGYNCFKKKKTIEYPQSLKKHTGSQSAMLNIFSSAFIRSWSIGCTQLSLLQTVWDCQASVILDVIHYLRNGLISTNALCHRELLPVMVAPLLTKIMWLAYFFFPLEKYSELCLPIQHWLYSDVGAQAELQRHKAWVFIWASRICFSELIHTCDSPAFC